jgi:hypothetical protein
MSQRQARRLSYGMDTAKQVATRQERGPAFAAWCKRLPSVDGDFSAEASNVFGG